MGLPATFRPVAPMFPELDLIRLEHKRRNKWHRFLQRSGATPRPNKSLGRSPHKAGPRKQLARTTSRRPGAKWKTSANLKAPARGTCARTTRPRSRMENPPAPRKSCTLFSCLFGQFPPRWPTSIKQCMRACGLPCKPPDTALGFWDAVSRGRPAEETTQNQPVGPSLGLF